ncbi:MAG TPA: hypothetical protein VGG71_12245 [Chitinophagaceae bacterium]
MKKISSVLAVAIIYMFTIMRVVNAQGTNKKTATSDLQFSTVQANGINKADSMSVGGKDREVNTRAILNFNKSFKEIKDPQWSATQEGGFVARFEYKHATTRVFYDNNGKWLGTISGYNEDKLPAGIIKLVKTNYYDYAITYIHELKLANDETVYLILIQDQKTIKTIRVSEGQLEEIREVDKS